MDFISKYFTFSSPDPDEIGYGYLRLFNEKYHQKLSRKLGAYPLSQDIKKALPHVIINGMIIISEETYDEYLVEGYIKSFVNHDEKVISFKPIDSSDIIPRVEYSILRERKEFDVNYEKVDMVLVALLFVFHYKDYKIQ